MSFWEEWTTPLTILGGAVTTIIAWNRDAIQNKVSKNQDKRDASERAVNIMQDVLESVNAAREADKQREDECHRALEKEREERKLVEQELRDMITRLTQQMEFYREKVVELEKKFGV